MEGEFEVMRTVGKWREGMKNDWEVRRIGERRTEKPW
jgi:hypothetical protein